MGQLKYLKSTIGRKQLVGITGIGLSLFVLGHMLGNLFILVSPDAYNKYGHAIVSNPLLYVAEAGLIVMFLGHIVNALKLTFENSKAKGMGYAVSSRTDKATSLVTKTMWHQGIIILVFLGLHLNTFKYGTMYDVEIEGVVVRDLHRLIVEVFQSPIYVGGYLVALLVLSLHLSHGLSSAIQSIGFHHPRYTPKIEILAKLYSALVLVGFAVQPLYVHFIYKG